MKKTAFAIIFLIFVSGIIYITAMPDIKESGKPFNVLKAKAKDIGGVSIAQFITNSIELSNAEQNKAEILGYSENSVYFQIFTVVDNMEFMKELGIYGTSYIIIDTDGNIAVKKPGLITSLDFAEIVGSLHMH